ncbi:MAG TPA: ATP-dependent Clp protease adaptor ClpS [Acidobacteriota bacterium]
MASDQQFTFGLDADPQIKEKSDLRTPRLYRVILHNDHYTTMEFVIDILVKVFHKPAREANRIMLDVHRRGSGVCGVYSYDIARTKISQVLTRAREQEFPLTCTIEEA